MPTPETHPGFSPEKRPRPSLAAIGVATVMGAGFSPIAPGTFGSVAGVGLSMLTLAWPLAAKLAVLVGVTLAGWWASDRIGRAWGHDHQRVVIDEVAGQYLTLLFAAGTHLSFFIGFLLFRFFDITKPQPARYFDNKKSGWYTMADDLIAGLYGLAALTLVELAIRQIKP